MDGVLIQLDDEARAKLREMREAGRFDGSALRVSVDEEGASFQYRIEVVDLVAREEGDDVVDDEGIRFYVDPASAPRLRGSTLCYVDAISGGGFRFENPNRPRLLENPLAARVQRVLDERINPGVAAHGGRVVLMDVQDARVIVQFGGGCQGCGMADLTLKEGVVAALREEIPEIAEVVDATDHAAGENPYY
jgi:Fe/S biogenesis protein NfuA